MCELCCGRNSHLFFMKGSFIIAKFIKSAILIIVILFLGVILFQLFLGFSTSKTEEIKQEEIIVEKKEDKILDKVMSMSLDEKVGQLFIAGIDSNTSLNEDDISLIEKFKIGGLIFFRRNISSANQTVNLINEIKTLNSEYGNIPLFLSLDQEGGTVTRLPEEILKFNSARKIGDKNDEDYAYEHSSLMGEIIKSLGFNMDFAPVLDISTNPNNTVISSRAFSSDKEMVSKFGIITMNALKDSGIIPVGKHYPGHGDTNEDSHYELPVLEHDIERLMDIELYPFRNAIQNGMDFILVSHLFYKNIDSENIATLSKTFLYEILIKKLKFRGIIITDDMIMKGLTNTESIPDACVKALKAGVDILMIGSGYENLVLSIEKIKQSILDGELDEGEIDRKVYNILRIKERYKLDNESISNVDVKEINAKIQSLQVK